MNKSQCRRIKVKWENKFKKWQRFLALRGKGWFIPRSKMLAKNLRAAGKMTVFRSTVPPPTYVRLSYGETPEQLKPFIGQWISFCEPLMDPITKRVAYGPLVGNISRVITDPTKVNYFLVDSVEKIVYADPYYVEEACSYSFICSKTLHYRPKSPPDVLMVDAMHAYTKKPYNVSIDNINNPDPDIKIVQGEQLDYLLNHLLPNAVSEYDYHYRYEL